MRKRRLLRSAVSLALAVMMGVSALPQTALAARIPKAGVKYVYKDNDPSTKIRTGIEAVNLEGVTYYDIEQGKGDTAPVDGKEADFFKKVLLGEASDDLKNTKYKGKSNLLEQWAEIAEKIFEQNETYSADINASGDFESNFEKRWGSAGYTDVSRALSSIDPSTSGSRRHDYTKVQGLTYAKSLEQVRRKACDEIVYGINTGAMDREYDKHSDTFFSHTDGDNTMKSLHNDKSQDVYYTMVTCIDDEGNTYCYHYNSFVLAFYDFKLVPLAGEGLRYISNAEGYESIEEAAKHEVPGVVFESTGDATPKVSYYENRSMETNSVGLSTTTSHEETASNTFENSKSFSFEETIGFDVEHKFGLPNVAQTSLNINGSFKTGQVIETAFSDTKSVTDSSSHTVVSNIDLPAQTAATIESEEGKGNVILDYKLPVGISYKVAIASMGGQLYADDVAVMSFSTAGYTQKTFSTTFGGSDQKGGLTARENLYVRAISNINTPGFEESYGNTWGYRNRHTGDKYTTDKVDWKRMINGTIDPEEKKIPYSVYYKEVDEKGNLVGNTLDVFDRAGSRGFEYAAEGAKTFNYKYTYKPKKGGDPVTVEIPATLYKGSVKDTDGSALDNTFVASTDSKSIVLDKEDKKIIFYYKLDWTVVPEEDRPHQMNASDDDVIPEEDNSNPNYDEIKDIISWLAVHNPLSAAGSTVNYRVESKSTMVGEIIPLYSLDTIKLGNNANFGNMVISEDGKNIYVGSYYDADSLMDLTIYPGDKFLPRQLDLLAYNKNLVAYYGFNPTFGSWKAVEKNEEGDWVPSTKASKVASVETDDTTGNQYVLAGNEEGTYYIQYFINEDAYKAKQDTEYSKNEDVKRPVVKLNIRQKAFDGKVTLTGSYTGMVDAEPVDLNDQLSVFVSDANGKRLDEEVTWSAKQTKGISITSDGKVTFDKAGSYQVRVNVEEKYSDWVTIEAVEAPALTTITFTKPDYKSAEITLTDSKKSLDFDLNSYLDYYDQYGDEWTGDKPDVTFSLYDETMGGSIDGDILTVTKEGDFKVYASAEGYSIDPITISVTDGRKVGNINISGSYEAIVGDPEEDLDSKLSVTIKDGSGKELVQPYTWEAQELSGITVSEDGQVKASAAGTYHVRVKNEAGQVSDWFEITAKVPAVNISQTSMTLTVGYTGTLAAANTPANAKNPTLTWSCSNDNVSFNNGQVTANKVGTTVITVTNAYGSSASCTVNVIETASVATVTKSGKSIYVSWLPVNGAQAYEVYGIHCNGQYKLLKTVGPNQFNAKITKIGKKKLSKSCYKFFVAAYKMVGGQKIYISQSLPVHLLYKKSSKYANAKSVVLSGTPYIAVGGSSKFNAAVKIQKKRKQVTHEMGIRYISSNPAVAIVDSNGTVYGKSAGSCYIYAIAVDGKYAVTQVYVQ